MAPKDKSSEIILPSKGNKIQCECTISYYYQCNCAGYKYYENEFLRPILLIKSNTNWD